LNEILVKTKKIYSVSPAKPFYIKKRSKYLIKKLMALEVCLANTGNGLKEGDREKSSQYFLSPAKKEEKKFCNCHQIRV